MLSALPAFVVGTAVVRGLGVSEVWSFAIVMPLLILAWFYFVVNRQPATSALPGVQVNHSNWT